MKFDQKLIKARLLRRYKRFLADVELESGETVTAHTSNPGAMTGLTRPGSTVYLTYHDKPSRKLKYTWELIRVGRSLVGVNTLLPNALVAEGIESGTIRELAGYTSLRREVGYGKRGSRVDLLLEGAELPPCYVEVKNVSLVEDGGALFPDAKTERGKKHLRDLMDEVRAGRRAVLCFVVQRKDATWVGPADAIDPEYGEILRAAAREGVEVIAYRARVGTRQVVITEPMPIRLDPR